VEEKVRGPEETKVEDEKQVDKEKPAIAVEEKVTKPSKSPMNQKITIRELNSIRKSLLKKKSFGPDSFAYEQINELYKALKDPNYEIELDSFELSEALNQIADQGVTLNNIKNIIQEEGVEGLETNSEVKSYFISIGAGDKLSQGVAPRLSGINAEKKTATEEKVDPSDPQDSSDPDEIYAAGITVQQLKQILGEDPSTDDVFFKGKSLKNYLNRIKQSIFTKRKFVPRIWSKLIDQSINKQEADLYRAANLLKEYNSKLKKLPKYQQDAVNKAGGLYLEGVI